MQKYIVLKDFYPHKKDDEISLTPQGAKYLLLDEKIKKSDDQKNKQPKAGEK